MKHPLIVALVFLAAGSGCADRAVPGSDLHLAWRTVPGFSDELPDGIDVYEGVERETPLQAWFVRVDLHARGITPRVEVSADSDRRETITDFARRTGAVVVLNGGYFRMDLDPARHVGLLYRDGHTIEDATFAVIRDTLRYYIARGTLGLTGAGGVDVAWVRSRGDSLFEWKTPFPNRPGRPVPDPGLSGATVWPMQDALAAGPVLVQDGQIAVATDPEAFFGSSITEVHPRSAAGYDRRGALILLVVDGRQPSSRGVSLEELAAIMRSLGCVEAVNLDGGGSSSLVVGGRLLNHPTGGTTEREVMSALSVFYDPGR